MKKTIVLLLLLISLVSLLVRFGGPSIKTMLGLREKSGVSVMSVPGNALVFLDGKETGKTPFEDKDLSPGEYLLKIQKDNLKWEGRVSLINGAVTVVNRDLALNIASSAGEILTVEKGRGITLISNPSGADIEIDGKKMGKTPVTLNIENGEHTLNLSHSNYINRSIRAQIPEGYNLTVTADLALSEADLAAIETPVITETQEVLVKDTPTGFLRVRDQASLNGKEIGRVSPGETLILLEELTGWNRIRMSNNTEGFVSANYVSKKVKP